MSRPSLDDRLTKAAIEGCCGNAEWRGHLCQYHMGYSDGAEAAVLAMTAELDALRAQAARIANLIEHHAYEFDAKACGDRKVLKLTSAELAQIVWTEVRP